ncbi:MAG: glycine cleavage system protein GcvH [Phycisphaerae bacterium]|jgi:glycine cleavage system H protein|nr:glycine cleavage system protein GcvH [Phycisphaerae bacterium]
MPVPNDRRYSQTHEWFKVEGNLVTIGITKFAADELTDVTFVELPKVGAKVEAGKQFGEVESVKATSDIYTAVGGTVREINGKLESAPELVNNDPFAGGWMIKVECTDTTPLQKLMDGPAYDKMTAK